MPPGTADSLYVRADLLDRQLVDGDGRLLGKVDDLELTDPTCGPAPQLTAILTGPDALGPRLSRSLSRWRLRHRRAHGRPDRIVTIPFGDVCDIGVNITVLSGTHGYEAGERTLRERVIERIPGARRADQ